MRRSVFRDSLSRHHAFDLVYEFAEVEGFEERFGAGRRWAARRESDTAKALDEDDLHGRVEFGGAACNPGVKTRSSGRNRKRRQVFRMFPEETPVLAGHRLVALARGILEADTVYDRDQSMLVSDDARPLQLARRDAHG